MRLPLIAALLLPLAAHAADPALGFAHYHVTTVLDADYRGTETTSIEARATTPAAAREIAQESVSFIEAMESAELVEATVHKPDGHNVVLTRDAARPVVEQAANNRPAYEDHKRLIVVFAGIAVGDTVTMTIRKHILQPLFPGAYLTARTFSPQVEWLDADVTLDVPAKLAMNFEAIGLKGETTRKGDRQIIHFHHAAPAIPPEPAALSPFDRVPRLFVSSFADWPAFGRAWAALAVPATTPGDAVKQRAAAITKGITDRRQQAMAVYAWVQRSIAVVRLPLGAGGYEPSSAAEVLRRGYADTKDAAILAIALLRALDIPAEPVLVNDGTGYTLPKTPNPASLNHVIVRLPEWSVDFDPQATGTPFGTLPFLEYGKQALRIGADAAEVITLPTLPDRVAGERVVTTVTLKADGKAAGDTMNEALGPFAAELRRLGSVLNARDDRSRRLAAFLLRTLGREGKGDFTVSDPTAVTPAAQVKSHFELTQQPGWLEGDAFLMPEGMRLTPHLGEGLLGPVELRDLPASAPTPCFSGRQEEDLTLIIPPGNKPGRVPQDAKITTPYFEYESHWTSAPGKLAVHRVIQTHFTTALCEGDMRAKVAAALPDLRRDLNTRVWLEKQ